MNRLFRSENRDQPILQYKLLVLKNHVIKFDYWHECTKFISAVPIKQSSVLVFLTGLKTLSISVTILLCNEIMVILRTL